MIIKESNNIIRTKNTFLNKAKNARSIIRKDYWESLHYEAKSRLNHQKFLSAKQDLKKADDKPIPALKALAKMTYCKLISGLYKGKAYSKFSYRFQEADNIMNAGEERFYKTNLHKRLV